MTILTFMNLLGNEKQIHFEFKHQLLSGCLEEYSLTLINNSLE